MNIASRTPIWVTRIARMMLSAGMLAPILTGCTPKKLEPKMAGVVRDVRTSNEVSLEDYANKRVLVVAWATWCAPCRRELPALQRRYEEIRSLGLEVVAISLDEGPAAPVRAFVDYYRLTFPTYQDKDKNAQQSLQLLGVPSVLIFDQGKLVTRFYGEIDWQSGSIATIMSRISTPKWTEPAGHD